MRAFVGGGREQSASKTLGWWQLNTVWPIPRLPAYPACPPAPPARYRRLLAFQTYCSWTGPPRKLRFSEMTSLNHRRRQD